MISNDLTCPQARQVHDYLLNLCHPRSVFNYLRRSSYFNNFFNFWRLCLSDLSPGRKFFKLKYHNKVTGDMTLVNFKYDLRHPVKMTKESTL
jgi:hypothetical protein